MAAATTTPTNGNTLPSFAKPDPDKYRITPPNARTVNDYLQQIDGYDASSDSDFTDRPTLAIQINGKSEEVGVYLVDKHLLCVYPIPSQIRTNAPNRRLYFVLTCTDSSRGKGVPAWNAQLGQLVTLDDGDQTILRIHGPAAIVSRVFQS